MCRRKVDRRNGNRLYVLLEWRREREREEGAWEEEEEEEGSIVKKGDGRVVDGLFDKYTGILFAVVLLLAVLRSVTINVRRCARAV